MIKRYDKVLLDGLMARVAGQQTKIKGDYIAPFDCPFCGFKNKGYSFYPSPRRIMCNRDSCEASKNNGGKSTAEFLGITFDFEKEYKPTSQNPDLPARAYLITERGLPESVVDGSGYKYLKIKRKDMNTAAGGVFFPLYDPGKHEWSKTCKSGRFFSHNLKSHNIGKWYGKYYWYPKQKYSSNKETWITESPIDSLSLTAAGTQSIGLVSAGCKANSIDLEGLEKNIILAPDNDSAGLSMVADYRKKYPDAKVFLPPPGQDWNHLLKKYGKGWKSYFEKNRELFLFYGSLATAETARDYATIYRDHHGQPPGLFKHDRCTFFSWIKKHGDDSHLIVERCGRFTLNVISYLKDTRQPEHPEYHYQLEITPAGGRPIKATASGRDLATPRGLKEFFLTRAKVSYEGATASCTALATMITSAKQAPEVNQIALSGYDLASKWYVFKHFAIDPSGKLHHPDKRGLYKMDFRAWAAPAPHAGENSIRPADKGVTPQRIHKLVTEAWGYNGAAALSWTVAGWFVFIIKEKIGYFPHLAATGSPASGKSALTVILNAMQSIAGEGLPVSQLSSKKGMIRSLAKQSGRFTALLEDSQRNERAFDYSIVLTGYNRGPLTVTAAFTNNLKTNINDNLGTLMFVCNHEPFKDKQEKQRVISLHFSHDDITEDTRAAYEQLCNIPLPELARVMVLTLQCRKIFEENWFKAYQQAIEDLSPLDNRRILQNHALILAFHRIFCQVHKIDYDLTTFMKDTAEKKCITSAERTYTAADHFFEILDNVPDEKLEPCLHFDPKKQRIFINLPGAEQLIRNRGLQFSINDNLIKALKSHPAYIRNSFRHRFPGNPEVDEKGNPIQRRSWVFDPAGFEK